MIRQRVGIALLQSIIRLPHFLVSVTCATRVMLWAQTAISAFIAFMATLLILFFVAVTLNVLASNVLAADAHAFDVALDSPQPAPNCVELVVNGSFEQTAVGWNSMAGSSLFTYAADRYVSGQRSLLLGSTAPLNIASTFGVQQSLILPAASTAIDFAFYYDVELDGEAGAGDQAYLTIYDVATNQLLAMLVLSPTSTATDRGDSGGDNGAANHAWSLGRYDLTPLAGKNIRLAFFVQNDGEPGRLAMRVDDVSIHACLPVEAFALQPLPTPLPTPTPAAPAPLQQLPSAAPITPQAASPQATIPAPQAESTFPQVGMIDSLAACRCDSALYTCADFSSWSVAQACYTQCQVTAGYDIHNLDEDRNGIACELALKDVTPLDATPGPQTAPSPLSDTHLMSPSASSLVTGAVMGVATTVDSSPAQPAAPSAVAMTISSTNPVSTDPMTEPMMATAGEMMTGEMTATAAMSAAAPITVAMAAVSAPPVGKANDLTGASNAPANGGNPAASLSPIELLSLLLFSPLGYIAMAVLVILGALSLWVAYLVGRRGSVESRKSVNNSSTPNSEDASVSDFHLKT